MTIKKTALILLTLFNFLSILCEINAQGLSHNANSKDVELLKNTTTVVVLDNDSSHYNSNITNAMNKYWKITKFIFIKQKEFIKYLTKPNYSYLYRYQFKTANQSQLEEMITISLNKKKVDNINGLDRISWMNVNSIYNHKEFNFCLVNLIQALHDQLIFIGKSKGTVTDNDLSDYQSLNLNELKSKELYVNNEYLGEHISSRTDLSSWYDFNIRVVGKEAIENAINKQDDNIAYVYYIPYCGGFAITYVICAKSGKIIYHDKSSVSKYLKDDHIIRINKKLKKGK